MRRPPTSRLSTHRWQPTTRARRSWSHVTGGAGHVRTTLCRGSWRTPVGRLASVASRTRAATCLPGPRCRTIGLGNVLTLMRKRPAIAAKPPGLVRMSTRGTGTPSHHHVPRAGTHVDEEGFTIIESRRHWRRHVQTARPRPVLAPLVGIGFNCLGGRPCRHRLPLPVAVSSLQGHRPPRT